MATATAIKPIQIGPHTIGPGHASFIIAEMSGNHNQSLDKALAIVDAAADTGVQALKIQTYTADTMTLNIREGEFFIDDPNSLWNGHSLYELYEKAHTPWDWHAAIFERCKQKGILCFSTPFDATAVDFLEQFDPPCYKIASFENTDLPLIRKVAATGRPMIISTGMATLDELNDTVQAARDAGCEQLVLLKCTSAYPAPPENANLATMTDLRDRFGVQVGLSDHTSGIGVAVAAVALGATVVEKHFTISRAEGGVDSAFSMEPAEMSQLVAEAARAQPALGTPVYGPNEAEKGSLVFRRSLYIADDLQAGDVLSEKNLRAIRPGYGLPPKHYDELIGKPVTKAVKKGTPMAWELVN